VVGSASIDQMVRLPSLPRPVETVAGGCVRYGLRRRGANQAVAAARIGGAVAFIGAVGHDEGGRLARSELEAAEIDVACHGDLGAPDPKGDGCVLIPHRLQASQSK
jgi:ribokinase